MKFYKIINIKKQGHFFQYHFYLLFFLSLTNFTLGETVSKKISTDLFGLFFEDINYAADGGLYAELVQNRSFEYNPTERREWHPLSYWDYISPGYSIGTISVESKSPVHSNNPHYIVLGIELVGNYDEFDGQSGIGLKNSGFDGIIVRENEKYNFSMFARKLSELPVEFSICLQNSTGKVIAESTVLTNSQDWRKYSTSLTAIENCDSASLVILGKNTGLVALDMISLFPDKTFKNRPNGMRADLAQVLADLQAKFIRFPGGCLVHGDGLGNMYRWKNTIGPVEQRIEQRNIWGYHQTGGLGYFEYFQFCEDIGAKPVPVVPAAVSCQNSGGTWRIGGKGQQILPMCDLDVYIQEVLDLIEWANGPSSSEWGKKRAEAGHPEPFKLEYLGIGNEDKITPEFETHFTRIYEAVKEKYPEIKVIGTVGPFHSGEDFEKGWQLANTLNIPMVDEHYYTDPNWFINNQNRYDNYDRKASKVYLGEYASWGNKLWNAIAEAAYLTSLERNGDVVYMASYAPLLAKKGFIQWNTDMIFFDNVNLVLTPNYHVHKMFMNNQGDLYYENVIQKNDADSTLAASCVVDSESGDVILKLVNASNQTKTMKVDLSSFRHLTKEAKLIVLMGNAEDENTFENKQNIIPSKSQMKLQKKFNYETPPMSLTIIRANTN